MIRLSGGNRWWWWCDPGRPIGLTHARVSSFVLGCRSNLVDKGEKGNLWESIGQLKKTNFRLPACCIDLKWPLKAEETAPLANEKIIKVRIEHGPTTRLYLSPDPWSFFLFLLPPASQLIQCVPSIMILCKLPIPYSLFPITTL